MTRPLAESIAAIDENCTLLHSMVHGTATDPDIVTDGGSVPTVAKMLLRIATGRVLGEWQTGTAYLLNDVVTNGTLGYRCSVAHTSGTFATDLAAGRWIMALADESIGTAQLTNDAVTAEKIAALAVTTAKIADANVTTAKIANANVTTAKIAGGAVNESKLGMAGQLSHRNRIINGGMAIDQRNEGASASVAAGGNYFVAHRWKVYAPQSGTFTSQRVTDAPAGFSHSLCLTLAVQRVVSAATFHNLSQWIEGYAVADLLYGSASAKSVTLSFWVKATQTGQYSVALTNGSYSYLSQFQVSSVDTWERKTITIPGDTAHVLNSMTTSHGLAVQFDLGCGANFEGAASSWIGGAMIRVASSVRLCEQAVGAKLYLTGVQLEVGDTATPFENRPPAVEMALCQRYFERIKNFALNGYGASGTWRAGNLFTTQAMRVAPTASLSGLGYVNCSSASTMFLNSGRIIAVNVQGPGSPGGYEVSGTADIDAEI